MRVPQGGTEENMVLGLFVVHGKLSQLSFWKENSFCSKDFVAAICNSLTLLAIVIDEMTPS